MDENNESELHMYDVECDNINNMLLKKEELVKEKVPVNTINDEKYRKLRWIIIEQKKRSGITPLSTKYTCLIMPFQIPILVNRIP